MRSCLDLGLKPAIVATLVVFGSPGHALAWGWEGHRIVAEIAERYLEPATARQVRELLAMENATTLAEVSSWADDIRGQRRETVRWHYVNIPIHPPVGTPAGYDAARDCPRGDCIVAKIDEFAAELRDRGAPPHDRLEALKFLIEFVGDVHQPLRAADDGDRGGNDTHLIFLGQHTTLHALWDSGLLAAAGVGDPRAYALKLAQSIKPADAARWHDGTAAEWATESHEIAKRSYGESHEARELQIFYEHDCLPVVNLQLEKAGVRLAALLNAALP
jgi:S1/P1 Nuclease